MDCSPPGCSVHGDYPGKNTGVGCHALLQGIFPTQGLNPGLPTLQVDSLPSEPPGKPKNIGGGILSLFQGIFQTRESNWGLLHCRQILYQLSYQGSPSMTWSPVPFQHGFFFAFFWVQTELQAVCWASQEFCPDGPECMIFCHLMCPILYSVTGKLLIIFHDSPSSSPLCGVNLDHINIISTSGYIAYWLYSFWATRTLWTYIYHRNCLMDEWIRMHNSSRKPA